METRKQTGHDGAFIDPDDLEAAARQMKRFAKGAKAAKTAVKVGEYSRARAIRSLILGAMLLFGLWLLTGLVAHFIVWLVWDCFAYPIRVGWGWWPL